MSEAGPPLDARQRRAGLPAPAAAFLDAAGTALQNSQIDNAELQLLAALALAPEHPETLRLLGIARRMAGRNAEAIALLRRALAQRPQDPLIHIALGSALDSNAEPEAAIAAFRAASALAPGLGAAWYNLGKALAGNFYTDAAATALERATTLLPGYPPARFALANVLRALGRGDAAAAHYRAILARQPDSGEAWLGLANLKHAAFSASDIATMEHALAHAALNADDAISMRFALAQALDAHARYGEAFAVLEAGNRRVHQAYPWDAQWFAGSIDAIQAAFSRPLAGASIAQGEEAIFVVSMPRAGSSLTEQILASHPHVDGAGEIGDLSAVIGEESQRRGAAFPDWVGRATAADWTRLGQRYLERTARWRRQRPRFTDKMPDNWRYVGAALAMLPRARVINCRRDPLETSFSCYRQLFANGAQPFSYDLMDIARYWCDYDRLSRHWREHFGDRVLDLQYEDLLADPPRQTRALLKFCGLDFDPACLSFYQTQRSVRTLSATQVREPLRRATARADQYGAWLEPLRSALADAKPTTGIPGASEERE